MSAVEPPPGLEPLATDGLEPCREASASKPAGKQGGATAAAPAGAHPRRALDGNGAAGSTRGAAAAAPAGARPRRALDGNGESAGSSSGRRARSARLGDGGASRLRRNKWINRQVTRIANSGNIQRLLQTIQNHVSEMNSINLATALHRVTRLVVSANGGISVDWLLQQPSFLLLRATVVEQIQAALWLRGNNMESEQQRSGAGQRRSTEQRSEEASGTDTESHFEVQCMSIVCWSCATLRLQEEQLMTNIAQLALPCLGELKPFELSNMVWAYAKLSMGMPAFFEKVSRHAQARPPGEYSLQCLSMIAWAFTTAKIKDNALFSSLAREIAANALSAKPQEIANTLWAYAKSRCVEAPLFKALADAAIAGNMLWTFKPQELSNTVWAFATVGLQHPPLFRQVVPVAISKRRELSPQNSANILWAYAKLQVCRRSGLFPALLSASVGNVPQHKPQEISAIVWAAAREDNSACRRFFGTTALACSQRLHEFPPMALANMVEAFAVIGVDTPSFSEAMATESVGRLHEFEPMALCNLFRGVVLVARRRPATQSPAAASNALRHDAALDAIAQHVTQRLGELQDSDLAHVSHSLHLLGPALAQRWVGTVALSVELPAERRRRRRRRGLPDVAVEADGEVNNGSGAWPGLGMDVGEEPRSPAEADAAAGSGGSGGYDDPREHREPVADGDSSAGLGPASDEEDRDGSSCPAEVSGVLPARSSSDGEGDNNPTASCEGHDGSGGDDIGGPGSWCDGGWADKGGGRASSCFTPWSKHQAAAGSCASGAVAAPARDSSPWRSPWSGGTEGTWPAAQGEPATGGPSRGEEQSLCGWGGGSMLPSAHAPAWSQAAPSQANGLDPWPWPNPWGAVPPGDEEGSQSALLGGPGAGRGARSIAVVPGGALGAAGSAVWPAAQGPWGAYVPTAGGPPPPATWPAAGAWPPMPAWPGGMWPAVAPPLGQWPQEPQPAAAACGAARVAAGAPGRWRPRCVDASCLVKICKGPEAGQDLCEPLNLEDCPSMAVVGAGSRAVRLRHGIVDERVVVKRMAGGPVASWPALVAVQPHMLAPCAEVVLGEEPWTAGDCYMAYTYCEQGTLAEWIAARRAEGKDASLEESVRIVLGVLDAASALLSSGLGVAFLRADEVFINAAGEPRVRLRHDVLAPGSLGGEAAKWLSPAEVSEGVSAGWPAAAFRAGLFLYCLGAGMADPYPHKRGELVLLDLRREVSGEGRPVRPDVSRYAGPPELRELMEACLSPQEENRPTERGLVQALRAITLLKQGRAMTDEEAAEAALPPWMIEL